MITPKTNVVSLAEHRARVVHLKIARLLQNFRERYGVSNWWQLISTQHYRSWDHKAARSSHTSAHNAPSIPATLVVWEESAQISPTLWRSLLRKPGTASILTFVPRSKRRS